MEQKQRTTDGTVYKRGIGMWKLVHFFFKNKVIQNYDQILETIFHFFNSKKLLFISTT